MPTRRDSESTRTAEILGASDLLARFARLQIWRRAGERAPHKPLLVLFALGRLLAGHERLTSYREIDDALSRLLREFGPVRRSVHPEYPFWRLQNDGIWEVRSERALRARRGSTDPLRSELLHGNTRGGFIPEIATELRSDPSGAYVIAHAVLDAHFPPSIHDDILAAVGLDEPLGTPVIAPRRRRDPRFRMRVLTAYERRCAICGFDVRLGDAQVGLDAAHIQWHQAGGPDTEQNGFALCALHHKLFDRGAFTVSHNHTVELSEHLHGGVGFGELLLRFHGKPILRPQAPGYLPGGEFLDWHHRQVFQRPARPGLVAGSW